MRLQVSSALAALALGLVAWASAAGVQAPAVLVVGRGLEVSEARQRLAADGRLRVALEEAG